MIDMDITTLAPLIARREISPVELTQAYLDRIEAHADLNAYITVDGERRWPRRSAPRPRSRRATIAGRCTGCRWQ